MRGWWSVVGVCAVVFGAGCGGAQLRGGTINTDGFVHGFDGYRVGLENGSLVSSEWIVRSHYRKNDDTWQAKRGTAFETTVHYQNAADGRRVGQEKELAVDLALSHRTHSGFMWIGTDPLPGWNAETDLGVIAHNVVQSFSRGHQVIAASGWVHVEQASYATRVISSRAIVLSGWPAVDVTFDWVNLSDREVAVGRVWRRVRLVVTRSASLWRPRGAAAQTAAFPLVFVFGYASLPADFARGEPDFERLLSHLEWADDRNVLNPATAEVTTCVGMNPAPLQLYVTREGEVDDVRLWNGEVTREQRRCVRKALSSAHLTPTGQPRWIGHVFGPYEAPSPQTLPQPEREVQQAIPVEVIAPPIATPQPEPTVPAHDPTVPAPAPAGAAPAPGVTNPWR